MSDKNDNHRDARRWPRRWSMFAGPPSKDGLCLNVDISERTVRAYGDDPGPVNVTEHPEGDYYGWIPSGGDHPELIQPHPGLFSMQFAYGPAAEVEAGKGEIVRLRVEPVVTTKDSLITRAEYDRLVPHGYAGEGTPLDSGAPGYWVMGWVEGQGTTLRTGVEIESEEGES